MHRPDFYFIAKFSHGIWSLFLIASKHQQIIFAKINISILYPPPYKGTVWYYEKADTELIRRAIDQFYWLKVLSKVNIEEKVWYVTNSLFNIIHKFIPHVTLVSDD